jgi:hypothetical protein
MNGARDVLVVDNRVTFADWGIVYDAVNGLGWTDAGNNH